MTTGIFTQPGIETVRIEDEMRTSYLTYAMSVIVSRALPDIRDGLKPVQRRILYAMHEMGIRHNGQHRKSARIAGEVLGKFHPHGEGSVYDALVRLAQNFSMRYPLIDGQGNFGSIDGDPPAAMRYTEARLANVSDELLADIDQDTVDFESNFDDSLTEPMVIPSRFPNMLVNGSSGIAVGMSTNIPPHNLGEICDAIVYIIDNPEASNDEVMSRVIGPDFPTGGIVRGKKGINDTYANGRGRIVVEAKCYIEKMERGNNREQIVVTELPYQVNKATVIERIATLSREKKIDGISDVRDESDRDGMRIIIELRRDAQSKIVLNNLYRQTALRSAFNATILALVNKQPQVLSLRRCIELFISHREEIIRRRSAYALRRAIEREHIVSGLLQAIQDIDKVIELIKQSESVDESRNKLIQHYGLSDSQSQAILDMQLRRLATLEQEKLQKEHDELLVKIAELQMLLDDPEKVLNVIKTETTQLKNTYNTPRRTEIQSEEVGEQNPESLVALEKVIVTVSQRGYIKRVPQNMFRQQGRGGKNIRGVSTRDNDFILETLSADTHSDIFFFSNRGRVYSLQAFQIPHDASRTSRGTLLSNLLPLQRGEQVQAMMLIGNKKDNHLLLLATKRGQVKSLKTSELNSIRPSGLIVINLADGDELVSVQDVKNAKDAMMVTANGQVIRFPIDDITPRNRNAGGVRGIRLQNNDSVIDMGIVTPNSYLLLVSRKGYGKMTATTSYVRKNRGGTGVKTFHATEKVGNIAVAKIITDPEHHEMLIVSANSQFAPIKLDDVRETGRVSQGVMLWNEKEKPDSDYVVSVAVFRET